MRDRFRDAVVPLRQPGYRVYVTGRMISLLGSTVAPLALAAALVGGRSGGMRLTAVLATEYVLYLAAMPVMGLWADRSANLRGVLVISQVGAAAAQLAEAGLLLAGVRSTAPIAAAAGVGAVAASLSTVTGMRLVPQLLDRTLLQQANATLRVVMMSLAVLGPAIAGILVGVINSGWLIAFDSGTFALAAVVFTRLPAPDGPRPETTRAKEAAEQDAVTLVEGLRAFVARRWLITLTVSEAVGQAAFQCGAILGPLFAARVLGGAGGWGWVSAGLAAGSAVGAVAALVARVERAGWAISAGQVAMALGFMAMGAGAPLPVIVAASALGGALAGPGGVARRSVVQFHVPHRQLGRVAGHVETVGSLPVPIAFLAAGHAADTLGPRPVMVGCALVMLAAGAAPLLLGEFRRLRLEQPAALEPT